MEEPVGQLGVGPPYGFIAKALKKGRVVPFFGAAASAVYRPLNVPWKPGKPFMPFGGELATALAKDANYPASDEAYRNALAELKRALEGITWQSDPDRQQLFAVLSAAAKETTEGTVQPANSGLAGVLQDLIDGPPDLAFIASWAEHVQGTRDDVNDTLHESFAVECSPGLLHETIAGIEATRLFITTNYDDMLEKALAPRQPHLIVDRGNQGLLVTPAGKDPVLVPPTGGNIYELLDDERSQQLPHPIVFKMHGSVDKADPTNDCYLITEEDYVDFLGRDKGYYVPTYVEGLMRGKDFLFLGYSLADWNVRVILRKLLKQASIASSASSARPVRCWAIVSGKTHFEQQVWKTQSLNIHSEDLQVFAKKLAETLADNL
jgi:hypothetical protein